jgi:predicted permease
MLTFEVVGETAGYKPERFLQLHKGLAEKLAGLPNTRAVTYSGFGLLSGERWAASPFSIPGISSATGNADKIAWNQVGPNFFETFELPIVYGRSLDSHDTEKSPLVAVVNEALARKYFGGKNPVGRRIALEGTREIVGVVRDAKQTGLDLKGPTPPMAYLPFSQEAQGHSRFAVRIIGSPEANVASVRKALSEFDPNLAITDVSTQEQQLERRFFKEHMFSSMSAFVGLLALLLASVGMFGVVSESVAQRTSEIGVRMTLGAGSARVLRMIIRESMMLAAIGLVTGFALAIATTKLIATLLFDTSSLDPLTYSVVALTLLAVSLVACWIPARNAAAVDPMVALRCD